MNHLEAYEALLGEGVRAEMLRAVLEATSTSEDSPTAEEEEEEGEEEDDGPVASTSGTQPDADMLEVEEPGTATGPKLSTASDNATFLASRLVFTHDAAGQPVALDAEGNGVMMGWEAGIMRRTADALCEAAWGDRRTRGRKTASGESSAGGVSPDRATWERFRAEEERGEREPLRVMNVGFGLGIVSVSPCALRPCSVPDLEG